MFCFLLQRSLTGFKNLDEVEYLEMKVDTRENSLGNFGKYKNLFVSEHLNLKCRMSQCTGLSVIIKSWRQRVRPSV